MNWIDPDIEMINNIKEIMDKNAGNDAFIENMILHGEDRIVSYIALEKIIDGTLGIKYLDAIIRIESNSPNWEDFRTLLEIGVMDGMLEIGDIAACR